MPAGTEVPGDDVDVADGVDVAGVEVGGVEVGTMCGEVVVGDAAAERSCNSVVITDAGGLGIDAPDGTKATVMS